MILDSAQQTHHTNAVQSCTDHPQQRLALHTGARMGCQTTLGFNRRWLPMSVHRSSLPCCTGCDLHGMCLACTALARPLVHPRAINALPGNDPQALGEEACTTASMFPSHGVLAKYSQHQPLQDDAHSTATQPACAQCKACKVWPVQNLPHNSVQTQLCTAPANLVVCCPAVLPVYTPRGRCHDNTCLLLMPCAVLMMQAAEPSRSCTHSGQTQPNPGCRQQLEDTRRLPDHTC
jgi:hypothetical protein